MDKLWVDLTTVIREASRTAGEELLNLAVPGHTVASVETAAAPGAESVPTGKAVPSRRNTLMDLGVVPSGCVSLPARDSNTNGIE